MVDQMAIMYYNMYSTINTCTNRFASQKCENVVKLPFGMEIIINIIYIYNIFMEYI